MEVAVILVAEGFYEPTDNLSEWRTMFTYSLIPQTPSNSVWSAQTFSAALKRMATLPYDF